MKALFWLLWSETAGVLNVELTYLSLLTSIMLNTAVIQLIVLLAGTAVFVFMYRTTLLYLQYCFIFTVLLSGA